MGFCGGYYFDFGLGFAMVVGGWVSFDLWWWMVGGGLGFLMVGGGLGFLMVGGGWQFCSVLFLFGSRENTKTERKKCIRIKKKKQIIF